MSGAIKAMKIYVDNLGWDASEEQLEDFFSRFGIINNVVILLKKDQDITAQRCGYIDIDCNEEGMRRLETMQQQHSTDKYINMRIVADRNNIR